MTRRSLTRSAALGLAVAALAAPAAPAAVPQDLRSPDAQDAGQTAEVRQLGHDLRSPDARDAGRTAIVRQPSDDLRAPDTRDLAEGRGTFNAPEVTVVKVTEPAPTSTGLDWAHVGIGAGGMLGLILLALASVLAVAHRRKSAASGQLGRHRLTPGADTRAPPHGGARP